MDRASGTVSAIPTRAPEWIREKRVRLADLHAVKRVMRSRALHTVCEEARCPNRGECFSRGTATFLLLGDVCTRACGFCDIANGRPLPVDPLEPARVAAAAREMGLRFVVVTSVDRDDLPDGGAAHFAATIGALRSLCPAPGVEVLTPDFRGRLESVRTVVAAGPTSSTTTSKPCRGSMPACGGGEAGPLPRGALGCQNESPEMTTKSGLMLGLGEKEPEVLDLLAALRAARVDIVTIGQYLRPSRENLPVEEYVRPEVFERYALAGESLGFRHVFSGPFVRSSYRAEEALQAASFSPPGRGPG
jgi:lipoic acid synthetase